MIIKTVYKQDYALISIQGSMNSANSDEIKSHFARVNLENVSKIILDLSLTTSVSGSGVGKLLVLYKQAFNADVGLETEGIDAELKKTFSYINLDKVIPIKASNLNNIVQSRVFK